EELEAKPSSELGQASVVKSPLQSSQEEDTDLNMDSTLVDQFTSKKVGEVDYNEKTVLCNAVYDAGATETRRLLLTRGGKISFNQVVETSSNYSVIDLDEDLTV